MDLSKSSAVLRIVFIKSFFSCLFFSCSLLEQIVAAEIEENKVCSLKGQYNPVQQTFWLPESYFVE